MTSTLLRQARTVHTPVTEAGSGLVDLLVVDGTITRIAAHAVEPGDQQPAVDRVVDLSGSLVLPAAIEPHAHLDKAFLAERVDNATGDLRGAIDAMVSIAGSVSVGDIEARAERAARLMARNGYVAVRTHVDVTGHNGLASVEALVGVRDRLVDVIDIEIVALTGTPVSGAAGSDHRALLRAALDIGADLVGGCPHLEAIGHGEHGVSLSSIAASIEASTDVLLEIAGEAGVGVDLHTDETLDPRVNGLECLARRVLAGFPQPVTASHCVSLGQAAPAEQQRIAELVAAARIGVVTLPHTNLWLGGRDQQPVPRGLTAIDALRAAGVTVAAGADNLQDPFNPLGRACPFETAALMVLVAHDLCDDAWTAVTADAARVVGRGGGSLDVGAPADLLAVDSESLRSAIADAPSMRRVFRRGIEIATA